MKVRFDFVVHWLWTIVFAILALSGLVMVGPRYGWVMNYNIATADYIHRILAVVYVVLTFICIGYEVIRVMRADQKKLAWFMIGREGYQLFTYVTTLVFIITGVIIWVCMDSNMAAVAFSLYIHEKLTYIVIASVIWHIYVKCHALVWPKKTNVKDTHKLSKTR
ncbi:cytochrome b subunit of formate dehydrogenase [Anaerosolibacter carboniphilus]|uniref:Cytochrome b subunit of formate dehydrogenase n=1 Tax=Anaerosolibacter carboniphilus TaxID=1417629 RepID=A0A841KX19_9FIRM|nr:cytochrome b/b6 domain-containing protein [Anaerosolibacter carboniphilus]MBB6215472.1 cytochrome b subunit of formate dehydrogenase [Anaerosolibacter carboniphilus]